MQFSDALEIGKPRRTKDGFLAVRARAARSGVYAYAGREVDPDNQHGLRDQVLVNVLRDEATVFDEKAVRSFIGKPVTLDHPAEPVTAANWKDHSRGAIMGALRDGEYLAFDLLVMDQTAIAEVEAGRKELSNGYSAELEFGDFTAPDGTRCQARQARITDGNHCALVRAGRAGTACRIGDQSDGGKRIFESCDAATVILADGLEEKPAMKIKIGDAEVDATNGEAVRIAVDALNVKLTAADKRATDAETQVATLTTEKSTLDAKVTTLEKQVTDAKLTPAQLRDAAKAYAAVVDKAKALGVTVTDEMDEAAIQKAVVTAKLGDAAKDWNDTQIAASFATLTKDVKSGVSTVQPIGTPIIANDIAFIRDAARAARLK